MSKSLLLVSIAVLALATLATGQLEHPRIEKAPTSYTELQSHVHETSDLEEKLSGLDQALHMEASHVYDPTEAHASILSEIDADLRSNERSTTQVENFERILENLPARQQDEVRGMTAAQRREFFAKNASFIQSQASNPVDQIAGAVIHGGSPSNAAQAAGLQALARGEDPKGAESAALAAALAIQKANNDRQAAAIGGVINKVRDIELPEPQIIQPPVTSADVAAKFMSLKSRMKNNVDNIDAHLNQILDEVGRIQKDKLQFAQQVMSGSATKFNPANLANTIMGHPLSAFKPPRQNGRSAKDVVDCTACRFAWLKVEMDVGTSYSEKLLYDSFITVCTEMQKGDVFFSPCNDMFVQVDDMIGDYLNGYTVSQMCENARLCR